MNIDKIDSIEEIKSEYKKMETLFEKKIKEEVDKRKELELIKSNEKELQEEIKELKNSLYFARKELSQLKNEKRESFIIKRNKKNKEEAIVKKLLSKDKEYWLPVFDAEYYAIINNDISEEIGEDADKLLEHFIRFGMKEGRAANCIFNIDLYMRDNPKLFNEFGSDKRKYYLHYIESGNNGEE